MGWFLDQNLPAYNSQPCYAMKQLVQRNHKYITYKAQRYLQLIIQIFSEIDS